jgi:hypothetical protein
MLRRLLDRVRPKKILTQEDLDARLEAKRMREGMETLRTGSLEGPPMFTHGGRESRGD